MCPLLQVWQLGGKAQTDISEEEERKLQRAVDLRVMSDLRRLLCGGAISAAGGVVASHMASLYPAALTAASVGSLVAEHVPGLSEYVLDLTSKTRHNADRLANHYISCGGQAILGTKTKDQGTGYNEIGDRRDPRAGDSFGCRPVVPKDVQPSSTREIGVDTNLNSQDDYVKGICGIFASSSETEDLSLETRSEILNVINAGEEMPLIETPEVSNVVVNDMGLSTLAESRKTMSDFSEQIEDFKNIITTLGQDHPFVSDCNNNMGNAYNQNNKPDKALECYGKSLEILLELHGEDYPDVADLFDNMAVAYNKKDETVKAQVYKERSAAIKERIA